jgi:hypothetical protein
VAGPSYAVLLDTAYALGRADGSLAAAFEPAQAIDVDPATCRGRGPVEFARLLWGHRPGRPPAGLEGNAPLWYARGFADGLAVPAFPDEPGAVQAGGSATVSRSRSSSGT